MKLKIKLFLWQLWLTLVVWKIFSSGDFTGWYNFCMTVAWGWIALWLVFGVLSMDFSTQNDHPDINGYMPKPYSGFFSHSREIGDVIESLMMRSVFLGAVIGGLASLVAYIIFDDGRLAMAALKVCILLFSVLFVMIDAHEEHVWYGYDKYISKEYVYNYLAIGALFIAFPMLLELLTHLEAALGS